MQLTSVGQFLGVAVALAIVVGAIFVYQMMAADIRGMLPEYATVKAAVAKGMGVEEAVKTLTFPQYKDWRNYNRLAGEVRALYELIQTGKRSYLD